MLFHLIFPLDFVAWFEIFDLWCLWLLPLPWPRLPGDSEDAPACLDAASFLLVGVLARRDSLRLRLVVEMVGFKVLLVESWAVERKKDTERTQNDSSRCPARLDTWI